MLHESITSLNASNVGQDKTPQIGKFDESSFLKGRYTVVVKLRHVAVRQRVTRLVVNLKASVEFQHVQKLNKQHRFTKINALQG